MPFPKVRGRVTVVLEHLRERVVAGLQTRDRAGERRLQMSWAGRSRLRLEDHFRQMAIGSRDPRPRRTQSRQDAGSRWRTERTGGIGMRKRHPASRQPFDIWRLVELGGAKERRVTPPEIVSQNENDIWFCGQQIPSRSKHAASKTSEKQQRRERYLT